MSPNLALNARICHGEDVGSDHAPIIVNIKENIIQSSMNRPRRWKLWGVNWENWRKSLNFSDMIIPNDVNNLNSDITRRVVEASDEVIGRTSGKGHLKKSTPWWNIECRKRVALRRKAKRKNGKISFSNQSE